MWPQSPLERDMEGERVDLTGELKPRYTGLGIDPTTKGAAELRPSRFTP